MSAIAIGLASAKPSLCPVCSKPCGSILTMPKTILTPHFDPYFNMEKSFVWEQQTTEFECGCEVEQFTFTDDGPIRGSAKGIVRICGMSEEEWLTGRDIGPMLPVAIVLFGKKRFTNYANECDRQAMIYQKVSPRRQFVDQDGIDVLIGPPALHHIILESFGNPFRPVALSPAVQSWNARTVPKLAETIRDTEDFAAMPILADACEEAGVTDAAIIDHLRKPGMHLRTCWALSLILEP